MGDSHGTGQPVLSILFKNGFSVNREESGII